MDKDDPLRPGLLPQYAHLKGMAECMPVIRKLLGMSEYGAIPTNNFIGRAVQRFVEASSKNDVRESGTNQHQAIE